MKLLRHPGVVALGLMAACSGIAGGGLAQAAPLPVPTAKAADFSALEGAIARKDIVVRPGRVVVRPGRFVRPGVVVVRPVRPWAKRAYYGTLIGGVALGTIIAVTAAGAVPVAPAPNTCWYWMDPSQTRGYWDYCQ